MAVSGIRVGASGEGGRSRQRAVQSGADSGRTQGASRRRRPSRRTSGYVLPADPASTVSQQDRQSRRSWAPAGIWTDGACGDGYRWLLRKELLVLGEDPECARSHRGECAGGRDIQPGKSGCPQSARSRSGLELNRPGHRRLRSIVVQYGRPHLGAGPATSTPNSSAGPVPPKCPSALTMTLLAPSADRVG
jgi:hypothetical protein